MQSIIADTRHFQQTSVQSEGFGRKVCLVFSDTAVLRHANVLDAVAALIASICLAVCKLSNDTSQVVEAAQGSVLGLRFTMTVIPIIGLVATFLSSANAIS